MKKYFINNNNNDSYSLDELATKEIKSTTKVRDNKNSQWLNADDFEELIHLIKLDTSYSTIKKSKIIYFQSVQHMELMIIISVLLLIHPFVMSINDQVATSFIIFSLLCISSLLFHIILMPRYFRIMKISKHQHKIPTKVYYEIQTCVSFKKNVSDLDQSTLKWKQAKLDYSHHNQKSDAKYYFDKFTNKKSTTETAISPICKHNNPPLTEKSKYIRILFHDGHFIYTILFIVFSLIGILVLYLQVLPEYNVIQQQEIIKYSKIFTSFMGFTLFSIILYLIYTPSYLRAIKRTVKYGYSNQNQYILQASITLKDKAWFDLIVFTSSDNSNGRDNILRILNEKSAPIVIQEEGV